MDEQHKRPISVWTLTVLTILMPVALGAVWIRSGYSFSLLMMAVFFFSSLPLLWQSAISRRPPVQSGPPKTWKAILTAVLSVCCIGLAFAPDEYVPDSALNTVLGIAVAFLAFEQISSFLKMRRSLQSGAPSAEHTSEQD